VKVRNVEEAAEVAHVDTADEPHNEEH